MARHPHHDRIAASRQGGGAQREGDGDGLARPHQEGEMTRDAGRILRHVDDAGCRPAADLRYRPVQGGGDRDAVLARAALEDRRRGEDRRHRRKGGAEPPMLLRLAASLQEQDVHREHERVRRGDALDEPRHACARDRKPALAPDRLVVDGDDHDVGGRPARSGEPQAQVRQRRFDPVEPAARAGHRSFSARSVRAGP